MVGWRGIVDRSGRRVNATRGALRPVPWATLSLGSVPPVGMSLPTRRVIDLGRCREDKKDWLGGMTPTVGASPSRHYHIVPAGLDRLPRGRR
jgi:hypothetical protein